MIFVLNVERGFSFWPFIVIPAWSKRDKNTHQSLFMHEIVHYKRQSWKVLFWFLKYVFSKKFRCEEEKLAFKAEIRYWLASGSGIDREHYIKTLSEDYWEMMSKEEAEDFVDKVCFEFKRV